MTDVVEEFQSFKGSHHSIAFLVLLPKCQGAVGVGEFWSISLLNSIYFIITMVMAEMLSKVIGELLRSF